MTSNRILLIVLITIGSFLISSNLLLYLGTVKDTEHKNFYVLDASKGNPSQNTIDTLKLNYFHEIYIVDEEGKETHTKITEFYLNQNPSFLLWIGLICGLMAIAIGLLLPLINLVRKISAFLTRKEIRLHIMISFLVSTVCLFVSFSGAGILFPHEIIETFHVLLNRPILTFILLLFPPLMVSIICFWGILSIPKAIGTLDIKNRISDADELIHTYLTLKGYLGNLILVLGIVIASGTVITSSVLAKAINAAVLNNETINLFPQEFIYVYAFLFSFAIAAVYLPVHLKVNQVGKSILKQINPFDREELFEWRKREELYTELLELNGNISNDLSIAGKIMAPILSGFLTYIL